MRHYFIGFLVTLFIAGSFSRTTLADDKENVDAAAAQADFLQGRYTDALAVYSRLHIQHPEKPGYLWNLARCHQFLGHPDEAITYFNKYIARPDVTDAKRDEARGHLAAMEKLKLAPPVVPAPSPVLAGGQAAGQPAQGGVATQQLAVASGARPDSGGALRVAGLVTAGVGVAGLVAGALFGAQAKSAAKELNDKANTPGGVYDSPLQSIDERGKGAQTKEWIFLGVGGAALIVGGILYFVGHSQGTEVASGSTASPVASVAVVPTILPHDVGAALSVTF